MLKTRLVPVGKKRQRSHRIRVMDSRCKRDTGRYLDDLGYWNRITKEFKLDKEKYEAWLRKGAQPTDSLRQMYKKDSTSYKLSFIREKIIHWLRSLPENKIEISLPETNFKPSKIQGLEWELRNFHTFDLKSKLTENNYQIIRKELVDSWAKKEEELVKQAFKELKIEMILSRRGNRGEITAIKDDDELSLLLRPFNLEFSITSLGKTYSTKNNPIHIVEPNKEEAIIE